MKIIGLGHYSRTGKDTLANYMVDIAAKWFPGKTVLKRSFAWKLKQICFELYEWAGMREPEWYDTKEGEPDRDRILPALGKTPVEIWVDMGTKAVREQVYADTWRDYALKTHVDADLLIVPDVRFPNEAEAIKELGGVLIKVVRPGFGPRPTVADHALVGYRGWDYVTGATGTLRELELTAASMVTWGLAGWTSWSQSSEERAAAEAVEAA